MYNLMFLKKRLGRRAQVSMEYLLVFGFALLLILPLIGIYVSQQDNVQTDVSVAQTERIVREIVSSAEEVYFMGEGAQKTVEITFPPRITALVIEEDYIEFTLRGRSGSVSLFQASRANLTGELDYDEGLHVLVFKNNGEQVEISKK